jgi:Zn finger protein HypA/HybF involved in hydrogenase expression
MKNCPNCNSEIEENFELCWNCNFSITENKIIEIKDLNNNKKDINCLRCNTPYIYSGEYKFHEGPKIGILGNLFEAFVNREAFDIYACPKCGKVEFFIPTNDSEYKFK